MCEDARGVQQPRTLAKHMVLNCPRIHAAAQPELHMDECPNSALHESISMQPHVLDLDCYLTHTHVAT